MSLSEIMEAPFFADAKKNLVQILATWKKKQLSPIKNIAAQNSIICG